MYRPTDACIVGFGGVFPGGATANQFIDGIFKGEHFISNLLEADRDAFPYDFKNFFSSDKSAEDQTYCPVGGLIDRRFLQRLAVEHKVELKDTTLTDLVTLEAYRQALEPLMHLPELRRAEIIMGVSNLHTETCNELSTMCTDDIAKRLADSGLEPEVREPMASALSDYSASWSLPRPASSRMIVARLLERVKERFDLHGQACLVDAACASSLAAAHLAIKRLRQGEADSVIIGGVDMVVTPMGLVHFSKMGATSDKVVVPFDADAAGINVGEGAGAFVLMRLADARAKKLPIHGVIRACEGSSDGRTSAIVEPTVQGQLRAYSRAYAEAAIANVDFVEAHGTGTMLGDRIELQSLSEFFGQQKVHLGSVKSLIGHACSAAGSAGMIKAIGILKKRALPPSKHFKKFPKGTKTALKVNTSIVEIPTRDEPVTVGVSSLGFGGINFHMVIQEHRPEIEMSPLAPGEASQVVICGTEYFSLDQLDELTRISKYKMPPKSLSKIDKLQRMGVVATEQTFLKMGVEPAILDRSRVSVISASMTGLDSAYTSGQRLQLSLLKRLLPPTDDIRLQTILSDYFKEKSSGLPPTSEDTLAGFGNNVIAGRIANAFDFMGVNFNVDSGMASYSAALNVAKSMLAHDRSMVVLVSADESLTEGQDKAVVRNGMSCTILANIGYCLEFDLPLLSILKNVVYSEVETHA